MARKEKYSTHVKPYLLDISKWVRQGEPEYCIYEKLGISEARWYVYKNKYKELKEAIKKGNQDLTKSIESMLYKRCHGYEVEETKTLIEKDETGREKKKVEKIKKYVSPSDIAILFTLKNKDSEKWKDRQDIKQDINAKFENLKIDIVDDDDNIIDMDKLDEDSS
jgi:hypothetical protein